MDIKQEKIDDLNATLVVTVTNDDYKDKVEKVIVNYRKTASIPGFRKGKSAHGSSQKNDWQIRIG